MILQQGGDGDQIFKYVVNRQYYLHSLSQHLFFSYLQLNVNKQVKLLTISQKYHYLLNNPFLMANAESLSSLK